MNLKPLLNSIINGSAHYSVSHHMSPGIALVFVLGCLFAEFTIVWLSFLAIFKSIQNFRPAIGFVLRRCNVGVKDIPYAFLELTFPADTTKSAYATEQLHILLRSSVGYHGWLDRLAARPHPYSMEVVGTNDEGIRFVIKIPTFAMDMVRHNLLSYLPGLKIAEIEDYLPHELTKQSYCITELVLTNDFVLPLKDHKALAEHDPMAYPMGHMTKLLPGELIALQYVAVPVLHTTHARVLRRIRTIRHRIALGKELSSELNSPRLGFLQVLWAIIRPFMLVTKVVLMFIGGMIQIFVHDDLPQSMKETGSKRTTDPYEQELHTIVKAKLGQHLYEVSMRILVISKDKYTVNERADAIVSSFQPFTSSYQSIGRRHTLPFFPKSEKQLHRFQERSLTPHLAIQRPILSSSELADLYHFPNTDLTKTEGMVKSRSTELPAPLSIRHSDAKLDVIVGVNKHGGEIQPVGMTLEQRQKHTYVIGKTGTGKTTLLIASIYQDMLSGKGLAMLDAHGDMFNDVLKLVPEHRKKDVVVFNPFDRDFPIGLNILDPGVHFDSQEVADSWTASMVESVFAKLTDAAFWGPRMAHILHSATLTTLKLPNPNLYTLQQLLTDKQYQKEVAATIKDPVLKQFWYKEMLTMGDMQLNTAVAPLTHRISHFTTDLMSRHMLLQKKSTISISDIMDEGKILLVNLAKGQIGEDQSFFFGTVITSLIWLAAMQRTNMPESKRRDFFVYVDEFQNFATPHFAEITSEARKFHVPLIVSHQNTSQIADQTILKGILSNSHCIICLKAGPDDEDFILPYMEPVVKKGDIVNLNPHHFFMKTTADESEDAFSGVTVPLDVEKSAKTKKDVIANSRKRYATPRADVEKYLEELFEEEEPGDEQASQGSAHPPNVGM